MNQHVSTAVFIRSTVSLHEATFSMSCSAQTCLELGQVKEVIFATKTMYRRMHVTISNNCLCPADWYLQCTDWRPGPVLFQQDQSKALPSVFSYSTLHSPLLSTHCNIHVCWGLTAGTACPRHQPLTARRMLSDLVKAGPRLCSPSLHNQHKSARHGCVLTTDQALCLVAHYDD